MRFFRDLFKNKDNKLMINAGLIFALGIFLLIMSGRISGDKEIASEIPVRTEYSETKLEDHESLLEKRLEEALGQVEGVGNVRVMVTLAVGREIIVQSDETLEESVISESDGGGGSREQAQKKREAKTVFIQNTGEPLILKEIEPKIEGVIIIAEGGGDVVVKDMLVRACQSLLGIELHKIQVLKMK